MEFVLITKKLARSSALFHGMYHDRKEDRYYKINDAGNEELVAIVAPR